MRIFYYYEKNKLERIYLYIVSLCNCLFREKGYIFDEEIRIVGWLTTDAHEARIKFLAWVHFLIKSRAFRFFASKQEQTMLHNHHTMTSVLHGSGASPWLDKDEGRPEPLQDVLHHAAALTLEDVAHVASHRLPAHLLKCGIWEYDFYASWIWIRKEADVQYST